MKFVIGFQNLYIEPLEKEAQIDMYMAELYFQKDSFIINPARGPIVNQKDLFESLKTNQIAGAALDTWYTYPKTKDENPNPSDFPFNELNNVILSPHVCGSTFGTFDRRMKVVAQNINNFFEGKNPINRVQELSKD